MASELSSLQASAIAEGEVDPCTMKRFNAVPSCNEQLKKPITVNNPSKWLSSSKPSSQILEQEEGCFTIVSSHKTGTKKITLMDKTKPVFNLEQLSDLKQVINNKVESKVERKRSSMVPNNNPFKRQKQKTVTMNECAAEVTQGDDSEMTPDSQKFKTVGEKKRVISGKKVESNKNTILNFFSRCNS